MKIGEVGLNPKARIKGISRAIRKSAGIAAIALAGALTLAGGTGTRADTAIVAGGCFWCVEADFESLRGVGDVVSGYTGGTTANPTYREVTSQDTGHFEAVRIPFDAGTISYAQILDTFFRSVDPTDAGGQFCDRGPSYRTAIFYTDAAQKAEAEAAKARAEGALGRTIVTPILPAQAFTDAEDYHQDYYRKDDIVLTRGGPKTKASAYKFYRQGCGRDQRLREIWGDQAFGS